MAPAMPARAPVLGDERRPANAHPPTAPIASRKANEGGMRRSGANGILSPAISPNAIVVAMARAPGLPGIEPPRVRPSEAAHANAAQAVMLRIPATKPSPNEAAYPCIMPALSRRTHFTRGKATAPIGVPVKAAPEGVPGKPGTRTYCRRCPGPTPEAGHGDQDL